MQLIGTLRGEWNLWNWDLDSAIPLGEGLQEARCQETGRSLSHRWSYLSVFNSHTEDSEWQSLLLRPPRTRASCVTMPVCDPLHSAWLVQGSQNSGQGLGLFHRPLWDITFGKHLGPLEQKNVFSDCIFTFENMYSRLLFVSVFVSLWFICTRTAALCEESMLGSRVQMSLRPLQLHRNQSSREMYRGSQQQLPRGQQVSVIARLLRKTRCC